MRLPIGLVTLLSGFPSFSLPKDGENGAPVIPRKRFGRVVVHRHSAEAFLSAARRADAWTTLGNHSYRILRGTEGRRSLASRGGWVAGELHVVGVRRLPLRTVVDFEVTCLGGVGAGSLVARPRLAAAWLEGVAQ